MVCPRSRRIGGTTPRLTNMYQLSARKRWAGKGMKAVAPLGSPDPRKAGHRRWVLLVHGYNNNQLRAGDVWKSTTEWLSQRGVPLNELVLFFWPGDHFAGRLGPVI